jgi:hypothetical protein
VQVRKSVVTTGRYHYPRNRTLLLAEGWHAPRREEVATMINNTFGVGVAGAVLTAGTSHAAHTAAPAAAIKHRAAAAAAAATDVSVDRGHT